MPPLGRFLVVRDSRCSLCGWSVPPWQATQNPYDAISWADRFAGRPCPNCCGVALGVLAGLVLSAVTGALDRRLAT
jgi:hypothetical protein